MNNKISTFSAMAVVALSSFTATNVYAEDANVIRLATTTSTYHSGLLDYILPVFKKDSGYEVQVLAAGTGKALKMGENGDVDLVMTHAPKAEADFVEKGYGIEPKSLMYNDFVLVGPKNDPAHIYGMKDVTAAFAKMAEADATFVSRGDDSGTNKKEIILWNQANIEPNFGGYKAVGQGMGPTLNMTSELQAYTLTDRGTWLAYQNKLDLEIMVEGDKRLFNPYQVILINPERYNNLNTKGARAFSDWLVSDKGQALINSFELSGQKLFTADAK
ncbi:MULTISPECIES: substrate-binding domain-containing protein [Aliivibrio]|uniref:Tungsten ABC transporter substrate-binding protein n=3 Tax=Aliivibrio TaxID=511678 RepID=A0A1B9P009_ALILO|nr:MULTISPECIES: substrate-binding domain-containing protein [Aliivibrio]AZL84698.1 tungsten ABC transporter substrate-binding protein [Aliivibrio salmonicida]MBB1315272.1 substrate-binding domain-containing protein [Aliivibrio sp. SR45-2]OCH21688.1 tungsten ABC transporter substrate-binding protein [Aliivibrio logei]OEF12659.1 tungsten ABC transporter substrate-binding protein [Aliivibrio logei 5S-186]CAQ79086.1 extracellular tungstate binding protein precursor [Aliivibrio salmonicida LFI1238